MQIVTVRTIIRIILQLVKELQALMSVFPAIIQINVKSLFRPFGRMTTAPMGTKELPRYVLGVTRHVSQEQHTHSTRAIDKMPLDVCP